MFRRQPDDKKVGAFGFKASDFAAKTILVWPENKASVEVFRAMRNRWHVGMAGPSCMDLSALDYIWRVVKVRRRMRNGVISDLLVMEEAALEEMSKKD